MEVSGNGLRELAEDLRAFTFIHNFAVDANISGDDWYCRWRHAYKESLKEAFQKFASGTAAEALTLSMIYEGKIATINLGKMPEQAAVTGAMLALQVPDIEENSAQVRRWLLDSESASMSNDFGLVCIRYRDICGHTR